MREFFGTDPSREEERQLKVGLLLRLLNMLRISREEVFAQEYKEERRGQDDETTH